MLSIDRRTLLREGLSAAAIGVGLSRWSTPVFASDSPLPSPCRPDAWKKQGTAIEPTEPWEGSHIQSFTSPAEPLDGGGWRIWYSAFPKEKGLTIACAEGKLGQPMKKTPVQCTPGEPADAPFALGHLPEKWKPFQVVHIAMKNGKHRIYFWAHGPEILRFLAADSDDGRRYRVVNPHRPVLYHPSDRAARGIPSPDGALLVKERSSNLPADEPPALPQLISNDSTNIYPLPDGSFEMYAVALMPVGKDSPAYIAHDNAPGFVRVVDRYLSADGLRFEDRKRVIQPDADDPPDMQFYHLAVTRTDKGCVGMLGHYRVEAQTVDLEWCFSPDGARWHRPHRRAWVPRGEEGRPDSYGIYPPSRLVQRDGEWWLFYTGVNSAHNDRHSYGPPRSVIMCATAKSIWA